MLLSNADIPGQTGVDGRQQSVLDGVACQLRVSFHIHFFENAGPIRADGFHAELERVSNLCHRHTRRDQRENLELAVGQILVGGHIRMGVQFRG